MNTIKNVNLRQNNRKTGEVFEGIACEYLLKNNYIILERNYRCKIGEIDIIAKNEGYLCFIEVKYRKSNISGSANEAVDHRKRKQLYRVAGFYLAKNKIKDDFPCRFDVIAIDNNEIKLYKNAFGGI